MPVVGRGGGLTADPSGKWSSAAGEESRSASPVG
jgi:hypothetical protein